MSNFKSFLWICFSFLMVVNTYSQREKDTIKSERLIITKQYNPSVNDAFKIKKKPQIEDSILPKPKVLDYSILKVPVASTFTPAKGRAGGLRVQDTDLENYDNYASLGAGNFTSIQADFIGNLEMNDRQDLHIALSHLSSQGGIDGVAFDDNFANNRLGLKFRSEERDFVWNLHGGLSYNLYNYYGIPDEVAELYEDEIGSISQHYLGFNLGGNMMFYDSAFKRVGIEFDNFSDNFNSSENRLQINPQVDFSVRDQLIENHISFDYLAGSFDNFAAPDFAYAWSILAYNPNIQINEDRFSIKIGAEFSYLTDIENSEDDFFIYPKIEGSYRIKQDNLIAFGGVDGGLEQNTYQQFSKVNPFIAPTFGVAPTNRQYDAFLGLKGGSYGLSYSGKISYRSMENNAFFISNFLTQPTTGQAFDYNNSFNVIYNDLNAFAVDVELDYSVNKSLNVGLHANYTSYDAGAMESAWNLPNTSASIYGNYKINDKWSLGTSVFYMGERDDIFNPELFFPEGNLEVISLSSFVDANFSVQYKINNQMRAFLDARNIFAGNYERWLNYPVQDLQIMGGVSFQFDW